MTTLDKLSYRNHFRTAQDALDYEKNSYREESYDYLLWSIEKTYLTKIIEDFRSKHDRIDYLDFAAGTGRIVSFLEPHVEAATAIEISESMASMARAKVMSARIVCADITDQETSVEGTYDLITAFRFVLNAEPALRVAAMRALARRLRDESSWLVFNNHGNLWSHKLAMWPWHALHHPVKRYRPSGNYLSHAQVLKLLDDAGLKVETRFGYGFLSAKMMHLLPGEVVARLEQMLAGGVLSRWGVSQIYIARLKA